MALTIVAQILAILTCLGHQKFHVPLWNLRTYIFRYKYEGKEMKNNWSIQMIKKTNKQTNKQTKNILYLK